MSRRFPCRVTVPVAVFLLIALASGCGGPSGPVELVYHALDDLEGLLAGEDIVDIDVEETTDGGGSLHVYSEDGTIVKFFELSGEELVGNALIVTCKMKSVSLSGWAVLELWVFPEDGEPRSMPRRCKEISRTHDWDDVEIVFLLKEGEKIDKLRLGLALDRTGHLWVDELRVVSTAMPAAEE